MDQKSLTRLLSQLSIKWKKRGSIDFDAAGDLDWLFDHGLIESGLDVFVYGMTCGESKQLLYVVSGKGWHSKTNMQAISDAALRDKEVAVQAGSTWEYLRLTLKGVEQKREGVVDCETVRFRIEQVEYFEENLTDEELARLTKDQNQIWSYMRSNIKQDDRHLKVSNLEFHVTREAIKRRVTSKEFARLEQGSERVVVGQEHESIQRDLIAILWPDLAELVELDGSIAAYSQASHRLWKWTGIRIPFCHRDWRALSEWAGLEPDVITDDWLDEFLVPRLRVLWLKQTESKRSTDPVVIETHSELNPASLDSSHVVHPARMPLPGEGHSTTSDALDYQYDGEWLTVIVYFDRFGLNSKSLSRWATTKCRYFGGRLLRRKKFPPEQPQWCYHRVDLETICDARDSEA